MKYYAHSLPGKPQEEWQLLEDHLKNVAEMARVLQRNSIRGSGHIRRVCGMIREG